MTAEQLTAGLTEPGSPYLALPLRTLEQAKAERGRFLSPAEVARRVEDGVRWKCGRCGSSMVVAPRPPNSESGACAQCSVVHWTKGVSLRVGLTFTLGIEPETHADLMGRGA